MLSTVPDTTAQESGASSPRTLPAAGPASTPTSAPTLCPFTDPAGLVKAQVCCRPLGGFWLSFDRFDHHCFIRVTTDNGVPITYSLFPNPAPSQTVQGVPTSMIHAIRTRPEISTAPRRSALTPDAFQRRLSSILVAPIAPGPGRTATGLPQASRRSATLQRRSLRIRRPRLAGAHHRRQDQNEGLQDRLALNLGATLRRCDRSSSILDGSRRQPVGRARICT